MDKSTVEESEVLFLIGLFGKQNLQLMLLTEKDESKLKAINEAIGRYEDV